MRMQPGDQGMGSLPRRRVPRPMLALTRTKVARHARYRGAPRGIGHNSASQCTHAHLHLGRDLLRHFQHLLLIDTAASLCPPLLLNEVYLGRVSKPYCSPKRLDIE